MIRFELAGQVIILQNSIWKKVKIWKKIQIQKLFEAVDRTRRKSDFW